MREGRIYGNRKRGGKERKRRNDRNMKKRRLWRGDLKKI